MMYEFYLRVYSVADDHLIKETTITLTECDTDWAESLCEGHYYGNARCYKLLAHHYNTPDKIIELDPEKYRHIGGVEE